MFLGTGAYLTPSKHYCPLTLYYASLYPNPSHIDVIQNYCIHQISCDPGLNLFSRMHVKTNIQNNDASHR